MPKGRCNHVPAAPRANNEVPAASKSRYPAGAFVFNSNEKYSPACASTTAMAPEPRR